MNYAPILGRPRFFPGKAVRGALPPTGGGVSAGKGEGPGPSRRGARAAGQAALGSSLDWPRIFWVQAVDLA